MHKNGFLHWQLQTLKRKKQSISSTLQEINLIFIVQFRFDYRENNIPLIVANTPGLYAQVFNDFGTKFVVSDATGEEPISAMIANITQEAEGGLVATLDEARHGFEDGDTVTFSEVEGMVELNGTEHKIKVCFFYVYLEVYSHELVRGHYFVIWILHSGTSEHSLTMLHSRPASLNFGVLWSL